MRPQPFLLALCVTLLLSRVSLQPVGFMNKPGFRTSRQHRYQVILKQIPINYIYPIDFVIL